MTDFEEFVHDVTESIKWFFTDELRFFLTMLTILAVATWFGL